MDKIKEKIWFVGDCHFSHKNIIKYATKRVTEFDLNIEDEN